MDGGEPKEDNRPAWMRQQKQKLAQGGYTAYVDKHQQEGPPGSFGHEGKSAVQNNEGSGVAPVVTAFESQTAPSRVTGAPDLDVKPRPPEATAVTHQRNLTHALTGNPPGKTVASSPQIPTPVASAEKRFFG